MNGFCTNSSMYALIAFLIYFFRNVHFVLIFYCCPLLPHCLISLAWWFLRNAWLRQRFILVQSFLYLLLSSRFIFIKQRACWSTLFIEFVCWQCPAMPDAAVWPMYCVWKFFVRFLCVLFHCGGLVQACCSFCDGAKTNSRLSLRVARMSSASMLPRNSPRAAVTVSVESTSASEWVYDRIDTPSDFIRVQYFFPLLVLIASI